MSRHTLSLPVYILAMLLTLSGVARAAGPTPAPTATTTPPSAPTNLGVTTASTSNAVGPGGWVNTTTVLAHFQVSAADLAAQVEVEPWTTAFTGTPNYAAPSVAAAGQVSVKIDRLENAKTYHWQARVVDPTGTASAWVRASMSGAMDFGVDQIAPGRPIIHSSTNPDPNRWYNPTTVSLSWSSKDSLSGIRGYFYVVERQARVIPPGQSSVQTSVRLSNLPDGVWFLALRAVDRAGNWSSTATYRVQLDRKVPYLKWLSPVKINFNPYIGPTTVRFTVNKDANVRLDLYRVGNRVPVAVYSFPHARGGHAVSLTWSGKTAAGHPVGKGYYFFSATVVDRASNVGRWSVGGIAVNPQQAHRSIAGKVLYPGDGKRIIISLSRETLYAYDGDKLQMQTFVTTGNPSLRTPTGTFRVMGKYHPYEFVSPWPQGSPYYYAPSLSQYAMLFRDGGYFLHDAPWRSAFGPGTDGPGQPGTNYGGTHGCVNIPPNAMLFLWNWTPVGTTVLVVP